MRTRACMWVVAGISLALAGCDGLLAGKNDLASMETGKVIINGHTFTTWLAKTALDRQRGLMYVQPKELGPNQGMLFIFDREVVRSFWMANTPQDLDVAFIRTDGLIVCIRTMRAYDRSSYSSIEPARYALEVRAGRLSELGIGIGDRAILPS